MFLRPIVRFVPDGTKIQFMRGRYMGLIVSAVLSLLSVVLFIKPGLNLGIDFRGGVTMEVQSASKIDVNALRDLLTKEHVEHPAVQRFGSDDVALIKLQPPADDAARQALVDHLRQVLEANGDKVTRADAVGASVSKELFRNGILALGISLAMILAYIWFRFEFEFAVSAVITLLLDITKTVGFLVISRFEFDLIMVAAILTVIGYSTNDKVVVYDRIRENLRKYRKMPLRELIDLSINETLNRTLATSATVFLASLPLALFGGPTLAGFAWTMLFGIVVGTSSSIFIAAPLLLLLGRNRLRKQAD